MKLSCVSLVFPLASSVRVLEVFPGVSAPAPRIVLGETLRSLAQCPAELRQ